MTDTNNIEQETRSGMSDLTVRLSTHYGQNGCELSFMSDGTIKLERHGHVMITTVAAIYDALGDVKVDNVEIRG